MKIRVLVCFFEEYNFSTAFCIRQSHTSVIKYKWGNNRNIEKMRVEPFSLDMSKAVLQVYVQPASRAYALTSFHSVPHYMNSFTQ